MNIKTQRTYLSINKRYLHRMESPGLFSKAGIHKHHFVLADAYDCNAQLNWSLCVKLDMNQYLNLHLFIWGEGGTLVWKQQTNTLIMKLFFTTIQCHVQHLHLYLVYNQYLLDLETFHLRYLIAGKITRVLTFRLIAFPSLLNSCNNFK